MSHFRKKLNTVLLLLLCLVLLGSAAVIAAGPCSLRVIIESEAALPVPNINVELYCVALEQSGSYTYTAPFSGLDVSAQALASTPNAENTDKVAQYAHANELDGTVKQTSAAGRVDFVGLEKGLYLILDRGEQAVAFQPYLLVLPADIDGTLQSNVISIPKTSDTDTKAIMVVKLWDDDMDAAGKRPASIEATIFRDGTPIRRVTLNESNSWQHVFYMLPEEGVYTVEESHVVGYTPQYVPAAEGYIIFNSYSGTGGETPPLAHVTVKKLWNDADNSSGKRPVSITVQLIADGNVLKTAALSAANHWTHTFSDLDPSKSYTAKEIIPSGYHAVYSGTAASGIIITNSLAPPINPGMPPIPVIPTPENIDIPVKVLWNDLENAAGKRPDTVTVRLITGGSIMASLELTPDMEWQGVFADVPADLAYTVWQNSVTEYSTAYSGNAAEGFVVTNTYTAGTTDPGLPPDPSLPTEPQGPVLPVGPVAPTEPQEPAGPADPAVPTVPTEPAEPTIPQTGAILLPVLLLMGFGILLTALGIVDILRRGEKR